MKSSLKLKLGYHVKLELVWILLKITHPASRKFYLVIICPQFTWKVDPNQNDVKFESVQTFLKITHLAPKKAYIYLVIICPNSYEKFIKTEIGLINILCWN